MRPPDALLRPATWGTSTLPVTVCETHSSWVFLVGDRAFKVKQPVTFPFLDYATLAQRKAASEREVELNRRLAPDIYLGVRALVRGADGLGLAEGGAPGAVEYVVEMRRFDAADTLEAQLAAGSSGADEVRAVGTWLAHIHAGAVVDRSGDAAESVKRALDDTFATLYAEGEPVVGLERFAAAFQARCRATMDARVAAGWVRDGHGDLRAEHLLLRDGAIAAVDCLEFSDALRNADVAADLAFLAMDLERLGHRDLVAPLLAGYRDGGGDPGPDSLFKFHAMCRALVRAKVAGLRATAPEPAAASAAYLSLAECLAWSARGPVLIAVGGPAASGKSTLARALGDRCGFAVLDSDAVRKELAQLAPTARGNPELYDAAHDDATYAELTRRGVHSAEACGGAILAATFRCHNHRSALVEAAHQVGARLVVVECIVPREELLTRAAHRTAINTDASDAGPDVAAAHLDSWRSFDDLPPAAHLPLRADRPVFELVGAVADHLDRG